MRVKRVRLRERESETDKWIVLMSDRTAATSRNLNSLEIELSRQTTERRRARPGEVKRYRRGNFGETLSIR